ncbi:MAG: hypothetical protein PHU50_06135, partial [Kiritimatiellae bacterium]|nr:hypothetical protein [Kiritimatiellia bacterium]
MNRILIVWGLTAALAVCGCGKKAGEITGEKLAEKMIEKALAAEGVDTQVNLSEDGMSFRTTDAEGRQADVKVDGDTVTIQGPDGTTTFRSSGAGQMPGDFPKDVFVYPGADVVASMTYPGGVNLALESADPVQDVIAKSKSAMTGLGWTEKSHLGMDDVAMLSYTKDTRTVSLIIQQDSGSP